MRSIEFFSTVHGLADACPIIPAKEYTSKWMSSARQDYITEMKKNSGKFNHIYQCPGIFDMFNHGYIIPMWHDVIIKTDGDSKNFAWMLPSGDIQDLMGEVNIIGKHVPGLADLIPKRPWSLDAIIKLNTPWQIVAPKGVKFIMLPIAYPDTFEFEATVGILDPGVSSEVNVQMWWNLKKGEHLIKAGTPLAHLIPLSEEKFELVCRDMTEHDKLWMKKRLFFNNFTFKLKRNSIKEFYYKHFGK
jgi:hypothetical protein